MSVKGRFPLFAGWLEERRMIRQAEIDASREAALNKAITELCEERLKMIAKPCPIASGDNCFEKCVHHCKGAVYETKYDGAYATTTIPPRCKLWGRN